MKKHILFFLLIVLFSCKTLYYKTATSLQDVSTPPGTIEMSNNLYFDLTEVTNSGWKNYMFWTGRIYGRNSFEYKSCLPDETVWSKLDESFISLDTFYLNHYAYSDYPVVGITFEQAELYSAWRSDRVMEMLLINEGVFDYNPTTHKDSVFSIERYFEGKYQGIKPNLDAYYPKYTLVDTSTFMSVISFSDSLNRINYKSCRKKFCDDKLLIECNCIENTSYRNDSLPYSNSFLTDTDCSFCKKELISHLKGNVREMTNFKGLYFGLSFIDSCGKGFDKFRKDTRSCNSYTGFRNICTYKKWMSKEE